MEAITLLTSRLWLLVSSLIAIQITLGSQQNLYPSNFEFRPKFVLNFIKRVKLMNFSKSVSNNWSKCDWFAYAQA